MSALLYPGIVFFGSNYAAQQSRTLLWILQVKI